MARSVSFTPSPRLAPPANDARPVLVVLHQEHSTPGRVGQRLAARGYRLDIRRPRFGDRLPETMENHAGAVVFGGPMSAADPDGWLAYEADWMRVPLQEGAPLLGICLGAQLLARHLGERVAPRPDGRVEIGWYPLRATLAGEAAVPGGWPAQIYQWHSEGMACPEGAELLAVGDLFPCQAFRHGNALAIQFHVELTLAMMHRWTTRGHAKLGVNGAQARADHFLGRHLHDAATRCWLERLLNAWEASDERADSPAVIRAGTHADAPSARALRGAV